MNTSHRIIVGDARDLSDIPDGSVETVVTSPPYPMIEIWDDLFIELDDAIGDALEEGNGERAFDRMHAQLDQVWDELDRILIDGGVICINIGDATRRTDGHFRVFSNHARILSALEQRGFHPLPDILWRKPTNSTAKFLGSGMLPPNAYVTLEHEHILVFRNGAASREFEPNIDVRYESAFFWEERNRWFSDVWTDIRGTLQTLPHEELRDRSGAFPLELPYRLICMYSTYGDTVFDPFWGTGTTTLAALCAGRNSIGMEIEAEFIDVFESQLERIESISDGIVENRLKNHRSFIEERQEAGNALQYDAEYYDFPVMTGMERSVRFRTVDDVERRHPDGSQDHSAGSTPSEFVYEGTHSPI